ncbi:MAG: hypothetical protein ACFNUQ_04355, partial [Rothia dentocariosa]
MNDEDLRTIETYRLELYMQACENLNAENEAALSLATNGRHWGLDGDGEAFKLALEAWRISQAALFDPLMA